MNGKSKTISMIVIGVLLAAGIISGISVLQQRGILPGISSSTQSTHSSGSGTLVLLLHDPPHVPANVSAVYVTYSNIAIHIADDSHDSGWIPLNQSGTINLMSVVNFTQTITKVVIGAGTFNLFRMNLSSVVVTYNSHNYTATVPNNELTVSIIGGLELSDSSTKGAVIDISPTILMYNSSSTSTSPSFTMIPSAKAYVVPSEHLSQEDQQVGNRENDSEDQWLTHDIQNEDQQTMFNITSAALSNTSISVTVKNTGNTSVLLLTVFIAPNTTKAEGDEGSHDDLGHSILFTVLSNGSLTPLVGEDQGDQGENGVGYNLSAGASATLKYSGPIPPVLALSGEAGDHENETSVQNQSGDEASTMTTSISQSTHGQDQGDESSTTSTIITSTSTTTTTSSSSFSGDDNENSALSIVSGQSYVIGVVSGDFTATTTIVAT